MSTIAATLQRNVRATLEHRFRSLLAPVEHLEIEDESHRHSRGAESHFKVLLVSPRFEGVPLVQRHRLVNDAARGLEPGVASSSSAVELPCHALSIQAKTPAQFAAAPVGLQSTPGCRGGDK